MSKPIYQELLPCPFCGCQPKEYDQIGYSSVKCKPCGFSIKVKSMDGPPYAPELWNRRAAVQPAGVAVPEGVDPMSLQKTIQKVVARERMRPLSHTDSQVAESIYQAIIEQLPLYEDVYDQLTEMIEPHVDRLGRKGCFLPASVVDSVRLLLDAYLAAAPHPVSGEAVMELRLCEQKHTVLKPGQAYLFTVDPSCSACVELAARCTQQGEQP